MSFETAAMCDTNSNADLELIREIKRRNGEVLMDAMRQFDGPVSLHELAQSIAKSQKMEICAILKPVRAILKIGVEFGFLYKKCDKYSVYPFHIVKPREQISRCKINDALSKLTSTGGLADIEETKCSREEPCIPGIRRQSSVQSGQCNCCDSCNKHNNDPCNKHQNNSCNKHQNDPCNERQDNPCNKHQNDPCNKRQDNPCNKRQDDPCNKQHKDPCGCGKQRSDSCSRQNFGALSKQRSASCSRQHVDPCGSTRANSCSRQQIDPYGKQRSHSCSRQHFDSYGKQRSDSCSKQNLDPCGKQRSSCCYKQRPDPCSSRRSDPCPIRNSSASRTTSLTGALLKNRCSMSGSKIARVSRAKSAHSSNLSLRSKGRGGGGHKENRRRSSTSAGPRKKSVL